MPGFTAKTVESLSFDFTGILDGNGSYCEGKGTIPEPSRERADKFFEDIREAFREAGLDAGESDEEVVQAVQEADEHLLAQVNEHLTEAIVTLGQGEIQRTHVEGLPHRYHMGFVKWLASELGDPTVSQNGTRR